MIKQFLTSVLLFVSIFSFAQSDILKSNRIASVIKIDGDASEWHLPLRFYDNSTKLFFDFSNDDNNLYLCFQSKDDAEQMKIMRAGITIISVSYTHLRAHETRHDLVCRLLL